MPTTIIIASVAAVVALVVSSVVTYFVTVSKLRKDAESKIGNAESRAREIIEMNRKGDKPHTLGGKQSNMPVVEVDYQNVVGQDDLTRFDKKKNKHHQNAKNGRSGDKKHHNQNRNNEKKPSNHS